MSFRAGNLKDAQLPLYTLNGEVLCDSACVKYLGHFICSDLSDDTDILRQRRCLTIQGNILLRKFHMLYWCETCTFQEFLFSYVYVTTMVEL